MIIKIIIIALLILWALHRVCFYILRISGESFALFLRRYYGAGPSTFLRMLDLAVKIYVIVSVITLTITVWQLF